MKQQGFNMNTHLNWPAFGKNAMSVGCDGKLGFTASGKNGAMFSADGQKLNITGSWLPGAFSDLLKKGVAMTNIRKYFPGPASCSTGTEKMAVYLGQGKWSSDVCKSPCEYVSQAIRYMQQTLNDWHIPRNEQDYISAYNDVIAEYTTYYNNNCITSNTPTMTTFQNSAPTAMEPFPKSGPVVGTVTDPVLSAAIVQPATAPAQQGTVNTGAQTPTPAAKQLIKGIPNWATYTGIALAAVGVCVAIFKK